MSGDWRSLHRVHRVSGGSPENHWVPWLIHKAKTEEPKTEMQQLQTGLTGGLVWSSVGLFAVLGLSSWDRSDWCTGLTCVELLCGSHQILPVGTGLTGGAHRPDRCRSVRLEFCVSLRSRV
jgi:hypothetical protein